MNSSVKNLIKTFFNKFFWRQHPETALRYLPIVSEIKKNNLTNLKILEIGSGSLGITPYLKRNIDGLDVDFTGPSSKFLNKIKGQADNLPFHRNSYDIVISVDVIEHLSNDLREKSIFEQLRVAKKLAIIILPVGKLSEDQDRQLFTHWNKIFITKNKFLQEHIENGLPSVDQMLVWIDRSLRRMNKKANIKSRPILNLVIRRMLMKTWISKNKFIYYLYMKGYLLLLPFLHRANFGNCYRRMFVIEFAS